ncbi:hypothetical protein BGZ57DRAFT_387068 [Hyaloscypha finlandica]|nr:hypothetical protein BGZ57DRAFT_387068 [Hyaloscypha finlandica]
MDHFETFDPTVEPFQVQCHFHSRDSPLSYDNLGYFGFPERKGWGKASGNDGIDFQAHPQAEVDEFLQSWLYVGLLAEWTTILGLPLDIEHFIRSDPPDPTDQVWITTELLPAYFTAWVKCETHLRQQLSDIEYEQHKQSCIDRLRPLLQNVLAWTTTLFDGSPPSETAGADVGCSAAAPRRLITDEFATAVFALRFSIAAAAKQMWRLPSSAGMDPGFHGKKLFCAQLLNNGWCPHDVQYLGTTVSMDACYYAGSYYPARALRDHGACDESHCQADVYNDSEGYRFRHADDVEDCDCALHGPDIEDLLKGFQAQDGFPLIRVEKSIEGALEIVVVPFDPAKPVDYIAFSHVWADGLGNPKGNALPTCQYPQLQQMANAAFTLGRNGNLTKQTFFWIDTLCIPVGESFVEYRQLAIQRMRSTYQRAKKVLVLDKEILSGSKDARPRERVVRIVLSTWMRRLWTFQEGFVAQDLSFQFRDGPYLLEDIWRAEEQSSHALWSIGGRTLAAMFTVPMSHAKTDPDPQRIFISTFSNLQWRSTTRAGDETLCVAVILGLDPLPLLNIASRDVFATSQDMEALLDKRMHLLLHQIKRFPPGIMFLSGNRLSQDGFKWAPASLLGQNTSHIRDHVLQRFYIASLHHQRGTPGAELPSLAELADDGGLKVSMLSIMLKKFQLGKIERRFEIAHIHPGEPVDVFDVRIIDEGEAVEKAVSRDGEATAIVLSNRAIAHRERGRCSSAYGALVFLRGDNEGEYTKVDFICRVVVMGLEVLDLVDGNIVMQREDVNRPMLFVEDGVFQSERKWHIF